MVSSDTHGTVTLMPRVEIGHRKYGSPFVAQRQPGGPANWLGASRCPLLWVRQQHVARADAEKVPPKPVCRHRGTGGLAMDD